VNDLLPTEAFVEAEELLELAAASYLAVGFFISCHAAPAQCAHDGIGGYCRARRLAAERQVNFGELIDQTSHLMGTMDVGRYPPLRSIGARLS
jgi:hypothetical protein